MDQVPDWAELPTPRAGLPGQQDGPGVGRIDVEAVDTAVFAWEWVCRLAGTNWVAADRTNWPS